MTVQFDEEKQKQQLLELRKKEEEDLAKLIAEKYNLEYVNLILVPINTDALRLIKEETARAAKIAAFNLVGKKVQVAVLSPSAEATLRAIKELEGSGYSVLVFVSNTESMEKAWSHYKDLSYSTESTAGALEVSSDEMVNFLSKVHSTSDIASRLAVKAGPNRETSPLDPTCQRTAAGTKKRSASA